MNKIAQGVALQKFAIDCISNGNFDDAKNALKKSVELVPERYYQKADDYLVDMLSNQRVA